MKNRLVLTMGGRDRVGVVKMLSNVVFRNHGNLEQSRMARLGGEFTGILLVTVEDEHLDRLMEDLSNLDKLGLKVFARHVDDEALEGLRGHVPYEVKVKGADHEGILSNVADKFAEAGVNIAELTTAVTHAPVTGAALFTMTAIVSAPPDKTIKVLRNQLAQVADEMGVDVEVQLCVE